MKKFIIILIYSLSLLTININGLGNYRKNNPIDPIENSNVADYRLYILKTSAPESDTIYKAIKKVFLQANKTYLEKNLNLALEFYNQFVNLTVSQKKEKTFWQEIRMSYSYMSSIAIALSNDENAIRFLKKALEISLMYNPNDFNNSFHFLFALAETYYDQSDYFNAIDNYNHAEVIFNTSNSLPKINKAQLYNNLALCYFKIGRILESNNYLNKSIEIKISLGNYDELANNYNNIGLVFQSKMEYKKALEYFNKSLYLYDSLQNRDRSAFVINNIGNLFLEKGSFDSSKYFYQKSFEIRNNLAQPIKNDLIISYNNLSYIYSKLNDQDSALQFNNLALSLNASEVFTESPSNCFSLSDYLISLADRIEINLKRYSTTQNIQYLIESFGFFAPTIKLIINQLIAYNSIFSTNIFINQNKRFFDNSMLSSHILDSLDLIKCPRTLIVSETYKSLSIINIPSEIRNLQLDSTSRNQLMRTNKYYQWQQLLFNLDTDQSSNETNKLSLIDSLIIITSEIDLDNNQFLLTIRSNLLNYFSNLQDKLLSKCELLGNGMLIDYYLVPNAIFIHTLSKNNMTCLCNPASKQFLEAVQEYPKSIRVLNQKSSIMFSNLLSMNLLDPVIELIKQCNKIGVIPDEYLTEIPFETLTFHLADFPQRQYLIEFKDISYRFSILNRNYSNILPVINYSKDYFGIVPYSQNDTSLHNLSGSAREIIEITNLFNTKNLNASSLIGKNATYKNLLKSNFNAKITHFSTHSFINPVSSNLSFLELYPINNQIYLFLPVLSSIPFQNDLLILNACETGTNLLGSSTGFVSFIKSMLNISIHNYIGTLWNIYDEPSYAFTMNFYENLLNGLNYSDALTTVKRKFIQSNLYKYPLFWSPFILYENN